MSNTAKPGAKPGNTNAQIGTDPIKSNICIRCSEVEKEVITSAAKRAGVSITDFILISTLANSGNEFDKDATINKLIAELIVIRAKRKFK